MRSDTTSGVSKDSGSVFIYNQSEEEEAAARGGEPLATEPPLWGQIQFL